MSVKVKLLACIAGAAMPCLLAVAAQADETFSVSKVINVPPTSVNTPTSKGKGGLRSFDIGFVDPVLGRYYLADRSNAAIDVVDPSQDKVIHQFQDNFAGDKTADTSGPNGVITVGHKTIWAGDGDSTVKVLGLDGSHIATINTGGKNRADELCDDPQHHVVLVANDAEETTSTPPQPVPFVTFISTETYAILGKIVMDGGSGPGHGPKATNGIEQCQWSPRTKKFYLNLPEVNGDGNNTQPGEVLEINPASRKIEKIFTVDHSVCAGPQGMAIGPDRQILLGCSNSGPGSIIINELTGATIHPLNGESGSDEVWYNPGDNQYFLANGNHKTGTAWTPQLGVVDPNGNEDPSGTSAGGSHSVAVDPVGNQAYVPINNRKADPTDPTAQPQGQDSKICSTHIVAGSNPPQNGDDAKGCIAVFTAQNDDHGICVADEDRAGHSGERSDPIFIRSVCPPSGDHDHDD